MHIQSFPLLSLLLTLSSSAEINHRLLRKAATTDVNFSAQPPKSSADIAVLTGTEAAMATDLPDDDTTVVTIVIGGTTIRYTLISSNAVTSDASILTGTEEPTTTADAVPLATAALGLAGLFGMGAGAAMGFI